MDSVDFVDFVDSVADLDRIPARRRISHSTLPYDCVGCGVSQPPKISKRTAAYARLADKSQSCTPEIISVPSGHFSELCERRFLTRALPIVFL